MDEVDGCRSAQDMIEFAATHRANHVDYQCLAYRPRVFASQSRSRLKVTPARAFIGPSARGATGSTSAIGLRRNLPSWHAFADRRQGSNQRPYGSPLGIWIGDRLFLLYFQHRMPRQVCGLEFLKKPRPFCNTAKTANTATPSSAPMCNWEVSSDISKTR